jgi:hypothetical protein
MSQGPKNFGGNQQSSEQPETVRLRRQLTLEELVAGMTPDREHPLEDGPKGEEVI